MVDEIVLSYLNTKIDDIANRTTRVEQASLKMFAYLYSTTNELKVTDVNIHDDIMQAKVSELSAQNDILKNQVNELTITVSQLQEQLSKCKVISDDYIVVKKTNKLRDKLYEMFHKKEIYAEKLRLETELEQKKQEELARKEKLLAEQEANKRLAKERQEAEEKRIKQEKRNQIKQLLK